MHQSGAHVLCLPQCDLLRKSYSASCYAEVQRGVKMPLKNARIHLRVTDEEKQSLVEKATLARQSVSQYILSLSENKTIIVVDGADEVTRQLLKIGNNINQIAIVANTSRKNESELPNYYLKRITDYQNEIMKLLKDLLLAVTKAEHECAESEKAMAVNQTAENKIKTEAGLTEALAYITNPAKISEVSRINCSGSNSNTLDQFRLLRLAFNQNNGIISHHFIQSFSPNDNVTPETVHRFGVEYAKLCFPNYQVVVSTHVDKEHLHNHIIVNSCNMITGRKYYDNKETMKNNRAISDKLCRKYGVSVISSKSEFKPIDQTTMQLALKHKSWKIQLLSDLDEAKESCKSKSEFISFLKNKNYEVRYENTSPFIKSVRRKQSVLIL